MRNEGQDECSECHIRALGIMCWQFVPGRKKLIRFNSDSIDFFLKESLHIFWRISIESSELSKLFTNWSTSSISGRLQHASRDRNGMEGSPSRFNSNIGQCALCAQKPLSKRVDWRQTFLAWPMQTSDTDWPIRNKERRCWPTYLLLMPWMYPTCKCRW